MEKELPSTSSVLAVLAESFGSNVEVVSIEDLSPGLSPALVMRVVAKLPESMARQPHRQAARVGTPLPPRTREIPCWPSGRRAS